MGAGAYALRGNISLYFPYIHSGDVYARVVRHAFFFFFGCHPSNTWASFESDYRKFAVTVASEEQGMHMDRVIHGVVACISEHFHALLSRRWR